MPALENETSLKKLVLLSVIAGMRSMMAPALLNLNYTSAEKKVLSEIGISFLDRENTKKAFAILTTAEIAADKLPFIPSRLSMSQLGARTLSGASTGALAYAVSGRKAKEGALLGSMIAIGSAALFFTLRKGLSKSRIIPEPLAGLAEDMFAFYLAGKYLEIRNAETGTSPEVAVIYSED